MDAVKADEEKNKLYLLPFDALEVVGDVLTYGARKYGERNWEKGMHWSRLLGAAMRHLFAVGQGRIIDPESNKPHLAHAACCILFLLSYYIRSTGINDINIPFTDYSHMKPQTLKKNTDILTGRM